MHPVLFNIPLPGSSGITIYSYGFFIVIGAVLGVTYVGWQAKRKFNVSFDTINTLFLLLLVAAVVGGKVFLFFERPAFYLENLGELVSGEGFVFYGSLLFTIPVMLLFFKKKNLPVLPMLDIMAVTTCIVHFFGRLGCFMAGCCHGTEWHSHFSVTFTDPACLAPLNTPLHPTQLYSALMILIILITLILLKRNKRFDGQLFLTYLMAYAAGRSVIEVFRGDLSRGFVIENYLSHSQFISLLVFLGGAVFYYNFSKKSKLTHTKQTF